MLGRPGCEASFSPAFVPGDLTRLKGWPPARRAEGRQSAVTVRGAACCSGRTHCQAHGSPNTNHRLSIAPTGRLWPAAMPDTHAVRSSRVLALNAMGVAGPSVGYENSSESIRRSTSHREGGIRSIPDKAQWWEAVMDTVGNRSRFPAPSPASCQLRAGCAQVLRTSGC